MKTIKPGQRFIKSFLAGVAATLSCAALNTHAVVLEPSSQSVDLQQEIPTNRLIIQYAPSMAESQMAVLPDASLQQMSTVAGMKMQSIRQLATGAQLVKLEQKVSGAKLAKIMSELAAMPGIAFIEPDSMLRPMFTPNDSRYNEQWHYFEATGGLNLPNAWDTTTGAGVVVGVIDTGELPHADLAANLLPGYDMISDAQVAQDGNGRDSDPFDEGDWTNPNECFQGDSGSNSSWHGTHVAGTIAAATNNGTGVAGVAFGAKLIHIRALGRCGGFISDIADAIIWGAGGSVSGVPANQNPAQVLNLSLGGGGACSSTTQNAINTARSLGTTVVVAAGNSNTNASNATPANCSGVVTVAATNRNGGRSYYSNFGSVVDVAAPGGDVRGSSANGILSTLNNGTRDPGSDSYAFYQGTSMATPHVAGVAALIYAVDPGVTPTEVEDILKNTARSFPSTCSQCGSGIVDAEAAVAAAGGGPVPSPSPTPPPGGNVLKNGVPVPIADSQGGEIRYTIEVPAGATNLNFDISGGSGDADLYVRFGTAPTTSSYDCRPYRNGNTENCAFATPQAGTYHVMVRAYRTYSGVSLVASYDEAGSGGSGGTGISESNLSGASGSWQHFSLEVAAGASTLSAAISGGSGDADLYVRAGSQPTTSAYNCRPYLNGNNESCTINNPQAGTWFVSLRAYSSYSGVSLDASAN